MSNENLPLVELIAGIQVDETNKDEIEEEVGCKTYIFIRKMTKLLELYTPTFN